MDWSKAKTILILSLLVTNLILGWVYLDTRREVEGEVSEEYLEHVRTKLEEKGIRLETELPVEKGGLNTLVVRFESYDPMEMNHRFFSGAASQRTDSAGILHLMEGKEELQFDNERSMLYAYHGPGEGNKLSLDGAQKLVHRFLKERGFQTEDMRLTYSAEETETRRRLIFTKFEKNHYIEDTKTEAVVEGETVLFLRRNWLEVLEEGEVPIYIDSAPKMILSVLRDARNYHHTILSVELCYLFRPKISGEQKLSETVSKGRTTPAWRVQFEDGHVHLIESD